MQAYGKSRDIKVLEGLDGFRYMTTPQIAALYFTTIKKQEFRIKKTCERMKRMFDRGYVQRFRFPSEPYIFTTGGNKYNRQIQHYLMIVDCWITLQKLRPSGGSLNYQVEIKQDGVQTDLAVEYTNNFRGEKKLYWIEVENESTGDITEKIKNYEGLQWSRQVNNLPAGALVIVYKKRATLAKLQGVSFEMPVKLIHFSEFAEKWEW
jgi:hypothetical protein